MSLYYPFIWPTYTTLFTPFSDFSQPQIFLGRIYLVDLTIMLKECPNKTIKAWDYRLFCCNIFRAQWAILWQLTSVAKLGLAYSLLLLVRAQHLSQGVIGTHNEPAKPHSQRPNISCHAVDDTSYRFALVRYKSSFDNYYNDVFKPKSLSTSMYEKTSFH